MPRHPSPTEGITTARLDGAARRLLRERVDHAAAVTELHAITTDPRLLGHAAGTARGTGGYQSAEVADLLLAAGGDPAIADERADAVRRRLAVDRGRGGIGNPS